LPSAPQPPPRPLLGLMHALRRARVKGVSSAHHEEVRGHPANLEAVVDYARITICVQDTIKDK
jgi:hypothetical protein